MNNNRKHRQLVVEIQDIMTISNYYVVSTQEVHREDLRMLYVFSDNILSIVLSREESLMNCLMKTKTVHCIAKEDIIPVPNFLQKGAKRKHRKEKTVCTSVHRSPDF